MNSTENRLNLLLRSSDPEQARMWVFRVVRRTLLAHRRSSQVARSRTEALRSPLRGSDWWGGPTSTILHICTGTSFGTVFRLQVPHRNSGGSA